MDSTAQCSTQLEQNTQEHTAEAYAYKLWNCEIMPTLRHNPPVASHHFDRPLHVWADYWLFFHLHCPSMWHHPLWMMNFCKFDERKNPYLNSKWKQKHCNTIHLKRKKKPIEHKPKNETEAVIKCNGFFYICISAILKIIGY